MFVIIPDIFPNLQMFTTFTCRPKTSIALSTKHGNFIQYSGKKYFKAFLSSVN